MSNASNTNEHEQQESLQDGMGDGRDTVDSQNQAQMGITERSEVGGIVREHVGKCAAGAEEDANDGNESDEVDGPQMLAEALRVKDEIVKDPRTAAEKEQQLVTLGAKAFIGFALINLTLPIWSEASIGPWNARPLVPKEAAKLCALFEMEGVKMLSYPMIGMQPEDILFLKLKKGALPLIIAGQHCREALAMYRRKLQKTIEDLHHDKGTLVNIEILKESVPEYESDGKDGKKLKLAKPQKAPLLYSNPHPETLKECAKRIVALETMQPTLNHWLVHVYKKDVVLGKGDGMALGLNLASNKVLYQYKATEDEM
ncbi:hypothetical protein K439DRAFT_1619765 [Ramaria rubella]|nr:hypothetical protein K439DRAFT_1619765 [Ramaria rubella]